MIIFNKISKEQSNINQKHLTFLPYSRELSATDDYQLFISSSDRLSMLRS